MDNADLNVYNLSILSKLKIVFCLTLSYIVKNIDYFPKQICDRKSQSLHHSGNKNTLSKGYIAATFSIKNKRRKPNKVNKLLEPNTIIIFYFVELERRTIIILHQIIFL